MSTGFWLVFLFGVLLGFLTGWGTARAWWRGPRR